MSFESETRDVPTLTKAEQIELLKKTGQTKGSEREHMIYSLALGTGLREHEIIALKVGDVVNDGQIRRRIYLTIFKGSQKPLPEAAPSSKPLRQIVHLPKRVRLKLVYFMKWKKTNNESVRLEAPLFVVSKDSARAERGETLSTRTLRHHFRRWQLRLKFEAVHGFHVLRHTALSNLYEATRDVRAVQKQARHRNLQTTAIYTHLTDEQLAARVEDMPC